MCSCVLCVCVCVCVCVRVPQRNQCRLPQFPLFPPLLPLSIFFSSPPLFVLTVSSSLFPLSFLSTVFLRLSFPFLVFFFPLSLSLFSPPSGTYEIQTAQNLLEFHTRTNRKRYQSLPYIPPQHCHQIYSPDLQPLRLPFQPTLFLSSLPGSYQLIFLYICSAGY